ncbi:MAG: lipoate--protein ligase family protein [Castellaniella sp.]|nr:lipoate--protein ligase family protein [Castellaniella sp.]
MPSSFPAPARYRLLDLDADARQDPLADEVLLSLATEGPVACLWQADQGLVVPRTYTAHPGFIAVQKIFAARGWPVHVRQSGGGVVPQGPGILNLSLACTVAGRPLDHSETFYRHLCGIIGAALLFFGIDARAQAVEGSFCDGRYNLAVGQPPRKIVGTAQVWRRMPGQSPGCQVGLAHALILADCDPATITGQANALEEALGTPRRYAADRIASLGSLLPEASRAAFLTAFHARLRDVLLASPPIGPDLHD